MIIPVAMLQVVPMIILVAMLSIVPMIVTGKTGSADQRSHIVLKNTKSSYSTKKFAVV
jgi:hypothetical protein